MNKPNESMPSAAVQPEKAPQMELSLNEKAAEYLRDDYYFDENYRLILIDEIKEKFPKLDREVVGRLAEKIANNIRYDVTCFFNPGFNGQPLPVYKYHSFLRNTLNKMFAGEAKAAIDGFEEEKYEITEKDVEDSLTDSDAQYAAAFDRFFNPLTHYNEIESRLHDNNIKKIELSRENQKLPVKNLDRRDQQRKNELNEQLMKLAKERKQLEAAKKDAKMLANFLPGYEMNKQEAKAKTEKAGEAFEEDKFADRWLEKNAVEKVAQLKNKLVVDSATRQARYDKKWEKRKAKEKQE
ncbi:MAG: hypothetical protein V1928_05390 [Parcubacteria group bacterium]